MDGSLTSISHDARIYALQELTRRSGVACELFLRWKIESRAEGDTLIVQSDSSVFGRIYFPNFTAELQTNKVIMKAWFGEPPEHLRELVPEFIVPFCRRKSVERQPLFVEDVPREFSCTEDILASIVLILSRFEELASSERDCHGRFPAPASLAFRHNYLDRPIVDEYGLAMQQVLEALMPGWKSALRTLRVKLSHDMDMIGIPFNLRGAVGHLVRRKAPLLCLRDLISRGGSLEPAYLKYVRDICQLSLERNLHSALYWMVSAAGPFDAGYDIADPRIARVIQWADEQGVEMGVHPGYNSFMSPQLLADEAQCCRKALQSERIGGRQHFLRWSPETWLDWERCGLIYDSSVGYAERVGFRAGTCVPFLPWLWKENRRADLLEIPLVVMDETLLYAGYMALQPTESLEVVRKLMRRCTTVGGVFTLLWHNSNLTPPFSLYYSGIIDALSGVPNYDWESDFAQLRRLSYFSDGIDATISTGVASIGA